MATASDEILAVHAAAAQEAVPPGDTARAVAAQKFLLEVMVAYGVAYGVLAERLQGEARTAAGLESSRAGDADLAEQARSDLLAGVSHELGTPLTIIKGNVIAIRRYLEAHESWPEELSQSEDDVEFAVERMLALREELMAASRNEKRQMELVPLQQRIFERFYRTEEAEKFVSFGLGLGLAIARDLVSALGGTIETRSSPGAGSTFTVRLPGADIGDDGPRGAGGGARHEARRIAGDDTLALLAQIAGPNGRVRGTRHALV